LVLQKPPTIPTLFELWMKRNQNKIQYLI
jgi:hypothetical protein